MANEDKKAAVYVAFSTFRTSLDALKQGIPAKIDPSVWPTQSGGVRAQLISAYKFLGLIDDEGNVTSELQTLVQADEADRKSLVGLIMRQSYPTLVELGESNASSAQLEEAMRQYNVQGDTLQKAIRFYLSAAEYADLPLSPHWGKRRVKGTSTKAASRRSGRRGGRSSDPVIKPPTPPTPEQNMMIVDLPSGGLVRLAVTADLTKLSMDERFFLFDVIDKMRAFEEKSKGGETPE